MNRARGYISTNSCYMQTLGAQFIVALGPVIGHFEIGFPAAWLIAVEFQLKCLINVFFRGVEPLEGSLALRLS